MTAPRILVRDDAKSRQRGGIEPAPELGWYLLGGLGMVFALVGGIDLLLTWYPPNFSSMEWKFGTVTSTLNSFPLFSLGLILLTVSGLARGRTWVIRAMMVVLALVVVALVISAVLYFPVTETAMASVADPTIKMGLKRGITKTSTQLVVYPIVLSWIAFMAFRRLRRT